MKVRTCLLTVPLLVAALVCQTAMAKRSTKKPPAPEPKPLTPAILTELARLHQHKVALSKAASDQIKSGLKLPQAAAVLAGQFKTFAGPEVHCCLVSSKKHGPWEHLVIDFNKNKNLTDDPKLPVPPSGRAQKLTLKRNGWPNVLAISVRGHIQAATLTIAPHNAMTGMVSISGKYVQWIAPDCNMSGKLDIGDHVNLMLDKEGELLSASEMQDFLLVKGALMYRDEKWYEVGVSSKTKNRLLVRSYLGSLRTLVLDHTGLVASKDATQTVELKLSNGQTFTLTIKDPKKGIRVPAQVYKDVSVTVASNPKPLDFKIPTMDLTKNYKLALNRPRLQAYVSQKAGKINVNQRVIYPKSTVKLPPLKRGRKGPLVEIFKGDEATGKPVVQGNMKYG